VDHGGTALVLGSGGARAAYEIGVARFLFEDLYARPGSVPRIDFYCGSSAGALNALGLGAFADRPLTGVGFLARRWRELKLAALLRPQLLEILRLTRTLLGCPPSVTRVLQGEGGILDPRPFRTQVFDGVPVGNLRKHLVDGHLRGVSLTATDVATGRTALFVETLPGRRASPDNRAWQVVDTELRPEHAFASAAIPLLFAPVRIQRRLYCDGSLRHSVPLSPALHLGADRVLAVSTQYSPVLVPPRLEREREQSSGSPLYLLGKAVNALTLDRVDDDLERLGLVNQVLEAGASAFGPDFLTRLNGALARGAGRTLHPVRAVLLRPSESLGRIAADHVRGRRFRTRVGGSVGRLFARLAAGESPHEADLLSYLLFDGPFAATLMDMGYEDARRESDKLAALLGPEVTAPAVSHLQSLDEGWSESRSHRR
jgi:NTE family protein